AEQSRAEQSDTTYNITDAPNFAWTILGFFIPLVGLILWLVWRNEKPMQSKNAKNGFITSLIVGIVISIIYTIIFATAVNRFNQAVKTNYSSSSISSSGNVRNSVSNTSNSISKNDVINYLDTIGIKNKVSAQQFETDYISNTLKQGEYTLISKGSLTSTLKVHDPYAFLTAQFEGDMILEAPYFETNQIKDLNDIGNFINHPEQQGIDSSFPYQ
ncbi:MAG: PLD nuclease N-terminal domain-containing protein, partial [Streptococcaceae bacterium]|nr:PLD nuclease N-terminal domain-containing protein [Streptococcaceae bacterium]